jgi:outer membrane immunogenic protein
MKKDDVGVEGRGACHCARRLGGIGRGSGSAVGPINSSVNATHAGWAAGAGAEWSLTGAWSVKAEYLHVDLGTLTDAAANAVGAATITHAHGLTEDMARVGFNYRFAH